jgi:hypothetical protein
VSALPAALRSLRASPQDRARALRILSAALVVTAALALRFLVLSTRIGHVDSDEAVVALMARHIWHGQLPAFFWGQADGGSLEAFVVALSFRIFGINAFAVKVVPLCMFGLSAYLVWRIGLRSIGRRASGMAVAILVLGSTMFVWWSTKARGHYSPALVIELAVILLGFRLVQAGSPQRKDAALLGLFLGLGWWETPQILYVAVPVSGWLLWRLRSHLATLWPVIPCAVLGAMPWLVYNLRHPWRSLRHSIGHALPGVPSTFVRFFTLALPQALGFQEPQTHHWLPAYVGVVIYAGCLGAFLYGLRVKRVRLFAVIGLWYVVLFPLFPLDYRADARYVFFIWPVVAILAGAGLEALARRWKPSAAIVLTLVAVLSLSGLVALIERLPAWPAWDVSTPLPIEPIAHALEQRQIRFAYGPYAVAYAITFITDERVIVAPANNSRYHPYVEAVASNPNPAYVLIDDLPTVTGFEATLQALDVVPNCGREQGFVVCRPDRPVPLASVRTFME